MSHNPGFLPEEIEKLKSQLHKTGKSFQYIDEDELSSEMAEFLFIGTYENKPVIFDCLLGTLRMAYESNLDEMAEAKALEKYPDYKGFEFDVDDDGSAVATGEINEDVEQYKAYCMYEIEEEGLANVAESIQLDPEFEFGVGLEVYLNVPEINEEVIERFIREFNGNSLRLDPTRYSFESDIEDEDEA
jgi:hypothetical protein